MATFGGVGNVAGKLLISVAAGCASDRGCRSAVEDEVNSWFGNETNKVEESGGSRNNTLYIGSIHRNQKTILTLFKR